MMQKITKMNLITPKSTMPGIKINSIFKNRSTMRSFQSKLIDLISLNQSILLDSPRSEKID